MLRLRLQCTMFFAWLFFLYNIERLHEPINLASFVYMLAPALALPIILVARLQRIQLVWIVATIIPVIILAKTLLGYRIGGASLPLTVTEILAVSITVVVARQIGRSLEEYRTAAVTSLMAFFNDKSRPFENGQADIYREIRRARDCNRPLALLAVKASSDAIKLSIDRVTTEIQRETVRHHVKARIAELLANQANDYDIITCRNDHFIALLSECDRDKAVAFAQELATAVENNIGVDVKFGLSVFPEEEVTFSKLLERAEEAMSNGSQHDIHASGNGNGNGNGHKNGDGNGNDHENGNGHGNGNGNGHGIGNGRPTLHEARTEDTCRVDVQDVAQLDDSDKHQECPAG